MFVYAANIYSRDWIIRTFFVGFFWQMSGLLRLFLKIAFCYFLAEKRVKWRQKSLKLSVFLLVKTMLVLISDGKHEVFWDEGVPVFHFCTEIWRKLTLGPKAWATVRGTLLWRKLVQFRCKTVSKWHVLWSKIQLIPTFALHAVLAIPSAHFA